MGYVKASYILIYIYKLFSYNELLPQGYENILKIFVPLSDYLR